MLGDGLRRVPHSAAAWLCAGEQCSGVCPMPQLTKQFKAALMKRKGVPMLDGV